MPGLAFAPPKTTTDRHAPIRTLPSRACYRAHSPSVHRFTPLEIFEAGAPPALAGRPNAYSRLWRSLPGLTRTAVAAAALTGAPPPPSCLPCETARERRNSRECDGRFQSAVTPSRRLHPAGTLSGYTHESPTGGSALALALRAASRKRCRLSYCFLSRKISRSRCALRRGGGGASWSRRSGSGDACGSSSRSVRTQRAHTPGATSDPHSTMPAAAFPLKARPPFRCLPLPPAASGCARTSSWPAPARSPARRDARNHTCRARPPPAATPRRRSRTAPARPAVRVRGRHNPAAAPTESPRRGRRRSAGHLAETVA